MSAVECFLGIDVAKEWLDLAFRPSGVHWREANDEEGWARVVARVEAERPQIIVIEASGGYEVGVVTALDLAGVPPVVANPVSTRRFAQSLGLRAKTDKIDAAMLARYGERMRPTPRPVPQETARALQEVLARHRQLTKMLVEEKNRRQQVSAAVQPSVDAHIAWLEQERKVLARVRESLVASDASWQARIATLDSVPGIGQLTATILAVGLPELGASSGNQLAALVGVAPYPRESGKLRGQQFISGGRSSVRHALFEAMMSTIRWDPAFAEHYAALRARGKPHKLALIACMRRLLGILTAMVRNNLAWQQTDVGQGHFLSSPT